MIVPHDLYRAGMKHMLAAFTIGVVPGESLGAYAVTTTTTTAVTAPISRTLFQDNLGKTVPEK